MKGINMKNISVITLFLLCIVIVFSCGNETNNKTEQAVGEFTWQEWQNVCDWTDYSAGDYSPQQEYVQQVSDIYSKEEISFIIFTAAWCPDSETGTPRIYKLFSAAGIDHSDVSLFGVDRDKKEPTKTYEKYNLEKVPTLIVLKDGSEIGRIVEYPVKSWEQDLAEILID